MDEKKLTVTEEVIEPELISPGGRSGRWDDRQSSPPPRKPGLLTRVKGLLAGGLALLGAGLILAGAFLTSTVIGAVLGIPMMLAGAAAFYLLFKFLSSGSSGTIFFRRF